MKIVVVNVERAADRRRQVVAGLEELGLEHAIWPAVDWRDLTPIQKAEVDVDGIRRDGRSILWGSVAASLSQRAVLADLVENGPDVIAMLEDDVTFSPELPAVLNALEAMAGGGTMTARFDIAGLHVGSDSRRFVPVVGLDTGHRLGLVRWSNFGAQGLVITRAAARRFLDANPRVRPGLDRAFARYWHHGLRTYWLRPPVVHHLPVASLVHESPVVEQPWLTRKPRRIWSDVKEGARKRIAFSRLAIRHRGLIQGGRDVLDR